MRTFIAIELEQPVKKEFARAQEELESVGAQVKWVEPDNIHLTLKFLGEVSPERVSELAGIIASCCDGIEPFAMKVKGVGAFPSVGQPNVVFAAAETPDILMTLVQRLEEKLEPLGFERERRAFKAHLTLGRVKGPRGKDRLSKRLAEMRERDFRETRATEVVLMKSDLTPQGSIYTPLHRVTLG